MAPRLSDLARRERAASLSKSIQDEALDAALLRPVLRNVFLYGVSVRVWIKQPYGGVQVVYVHRQLLDLSLVSVTKRG
ncbi:hypothetical protein FHS66_001435 [Pacificitalea manganoxidans]|nr:hypothetical protein [Pacificitalea manganoxidans]